MTPEQRAQAVLETFWFPPGFQAGPTQIDSVAAAIRAAVAEEREACARLVEAWRSDDEIVGADIAAAVRARP